MYGEWKCTSIYCVSVQYAITCTCRVHMYDTLPEVAVSLLHRASRAGRRGPATRGRDRAFNLGSTREMNERE